MQRREPYGPAHDPGLPRAAEPTFQMSLANANLPLPGDRPTAGLAVGALSSTDSLPLPGTLTGKLTVPLRVAFTCVIVIRLSGRTV